MEEALARSLMREALSDLSFILWHYVELMARSGLSREEIIEVLKMLGYSWC